ncbi:hypothetical protein PspLS_04369 [Pyricularia sp. CBS 133598]|nr:hypothetical protein PspLS_04369 [Pyricularia sp. CBS 133598]
MTHKAAAIAIGAVGTAMVAAPGLFVLPVLASIGFGGSGPIAGGIAASVQSGMGNVLAPSLFATLQSAAMGGYGVTAVLGTVQAAGGLFAVAAAAQVTRNISKL